MKPVRFGSKSILIFLVAIAWTASDARSQTDSHSLAVFTEATIVSVRQDGSDLFVLDAPASEVHGFNFFGSYSLLPLGRVGDEGLARRKLREMSSHSQYHPRKRMGSLDPTCLRRRY